MFLRFCKVFLPGSWSFVWLQVNLIIINLSQLSQSALLCTKIYKLPQRGIEFILNYKPLKTIDNIPPSPQEGNLTAFQYFDNC